MKTLVLAALLCAAADDLPKPLTEAQRAEKAKEWRKAFDAKRRSVEEKLDAATAVLKQNPTDTGAVVDKQQAVSVLAAMKKDPLSFGEGVLEPIGRTDDAAGSRAKAGQVGPLARSSGLVVDVTAEGALFEVLHDAEFGEAAGSKLARYHLVGGLPKAKKGAKSTAPGLWYYAGDAEVGGKKVAVLYPFQFKPDELPPTPKKK